MNALRVFGIVLNVFALLGVVIAIDYIFDFDLFKESWNIFSRGNDGGASNLPIFFGLCAVTGSIILLYSDKNSTGKGDEVE